MNDPFISNLYEQLDLLISKSEAGVHFLAASVNMSQRTLKRKLKAP